jgi:hypothetical protein
MDLVGAPIIFFGALADDMDASYEMFELLEVSLRPVQGCFAVGYHDAQLGFRECRFGG